MSWRVDLVEGGRIALASLKANRLRTVLTLLGMGIGVATLLAIVGIIQGLNASFETQLASFGSNTLYVSKFPWVIKGNWWEFRNRRNFTLRELDAVKSQAFFLDAVSPQIARSADVEYLNQQVSQVRVQGVTPEYAGIGSLDIAQGRFLSDADEATLQPVIVLGSEVVQSLFNGRSPLGSRVRIDGRSFRVIGTLVPKGRFLDLNQDLAVYIPFQSFLSQFGKGRGFSFAMSVARPEALLDAEDQLVALMRRIRRNAPGAPADFSVNRPEQLAQTYQQLTGALYGVALGVGFITLLVGGVGIMNIMLVSVRERTREIGIRRALGARKRTIVLQFLMEACVICAVGGAAGTLLGLGCAKLISWVTPLAAAVNPLTVVGGVGFAACVGLLFGLWPALRAAQLDPVEALRYE